MRNGLRRADLDAGLRLRALVLERQVGDGIRIILRGGRLALRLAAGLRAGERGDGLRGLQVGGERGLIARAEVARPDLLGGQQAAIGQGGLDQVVDHAGVVRGGERGQLGFECYHDFGRLAGGLERGDLFGGGGGLGLERGDVHLDTGEGRCGGAALGIGQQLGLELVELRGDFLRRAGDGQIEQIDKALDDVVHGGWLRVRVELIRGGGHCGHAVEGRVVGQAGMQDAGDGSGLVVGKHRADVAVFAGCDHLRGLVRPAHAGGPQAGVAPFQRREKPGCGRGLAVVGGVEGLVLVVDHQRIGASGDLGDEALRAGGGERPGRRVGRAAVFGAECARRQKLHLGRSAGAVRTELGAQRGDEESGCGAGSHAGHCTGLEWDLRLKRFTTSRRDMRRVRTAATAYRQTTA